MLRFGWKICQCPPQTPLNFPANVNSAACYGDTSTFKAGSAAICMLYYPVFAFFYLVSLLPLRLLYAVSAFAFFILYHLLGYRKKVVMTNLKNAFPEKTSEELEAICKKFYRNFCDIWMEMLKVLSISKKELAKRVQFDYSILNDLYKTGIPVQAFAGHFMNWEFANISVAINQPYPFLGIYMPVSGKILDRLLRHLRSRFGTVLLEAGNVKNDMAGWENKAYILGIAADQSPSNTMQAYWLNFMNQPSGFINKPWTKVTTLGHHAVYMRMERLKRGYYRFTILPLTPAPGILTEKELVLLYRDRLEEDIRNNPDNYLWTHRRWKKEWKEEYRELWIDHQPAPAQKKELEDIASSKS